jgi:hypothetical protein
LAEDALLVSAILLKEKFKRSDIHAIALGGHKGSNRINPDPDTYLAVRSYYFQAMAYSMNISIFEELQAASDQYHAKRVEDSSSVNKKEKVRKVERNDWTEEITLSNFLQNLTMLTPSVGRMHHIGEFGMGAGGNGFGKREAVPIPWKNWHEIITNQNRTAANFYLSPSEDTDVSGCICYPLVPNCGCDFKLVREETWFGAIYRSRYAKVLGTVES